MFQKFRLSKLWIRSIQNLLYISSQSLNIGKNLKLPTNIVRTGNTDSKAVAKGFMPYYQDDTTEISGSSAIKYTIPFNNQKLKGFKKCRKNFESTKSNVKVLINS